MTIPRPSSLRLVRHPAQALPKPPSSGAQGAQGRASVPSGLRRLESTPRLRRAFSPSPRQGTLGLFCKGAAAPVSRTCVRSRGYPRAKAASRQGARATRAADVSMREVNRDPNSAAGMVVTVCGGGNAAHVAAAMYAHHGAKVNVFLSLEKEALQWQEAAVKDGITLHKKYEGETYVGRIAAATTDPAAVVPASDLILIIVPAFAHRPILSAIGPHLKHGAIVLAMPAPGNFDLLARQVLGPKVNDVVLAGSECLPWACRIHEYAKKVELLGEKSPVTLVARPFSAVGKVIEQANRIHDASRFRGATLFLQATLFPTNPMLHPGIMFAFWSRWDGKPLDARPLFYEGVDDFAASVLEGEDSDLQATIGAVDAALGVPLKLPTLKEQMVEGYGDQIADPSSYKSMLVSNASLQGLYHPCIEDKDGKWGPDFKSRYLLEDIPHGLTAMKGVSQLMGVPTPTIDKVISWAQKLMDKEYLVGDQLIGKDVGSTSAPQAFGIATKEELLTELKHQLEALTPSAGTPASATG